MTTRVGGGELDEEGTLKMSSLVDVFSFSLSGRVKGEKVEEREFVAVVVGGLLLLAPCPSSASPLLSTISLMRTNFDLPFLGEKEDEEELEDDLDEADDEERSNPFP